jgi:aquaporin Z
MKSAFARHWPEYGMEALGLGLFMLSANGFAVLLFHPASAFAIGDSVLGRVFMGAAMGLTAVALIYSPWGQRSGAHFNPAVTLTFLRLGKVASWDAAFYIAAQFAGGTAGALLAAAIGRSFVADASVHYVVTVPGAGGTLVALVAEMVIAFGLMTVVLATAHDPRLMRCTGLLVGALVATYIAVEAPMSGMSMNPARTFASAVPASQWTAYWVYVIAPPLGMLLAAEVHVRRAADSVRCAKLNHATARRCIFRCGYAESR